MGKPTVFNALSKVSLTYSIMLIKILIMLISSFLKWTRYRSWHLRKTDLHSDPENERVSIDFIHVPDYANKIKIMGIFSGSPRSGTEVET